MDDEMTKMNVNKQMDSLNIEYWEKDEEVCPNVNWIVKM